MQFYDNMVSWPLTCGMTMPSGMTAQEAGDASLRQMASRCSGSGGAVVVSKHGQTAAVFTTERMAWASAARGVLRHGLNPGENVREEIKT